MHHDMRLGYHISYALVRYDLQLIKPPTISKFWSPASPQFGLPMTSLLPMIIGFLDSIVDIAYVASTVGGSLQQRQLLTSEFAVLPLLLA